MIKPEFYLNLANYIATQSKCLSRQTAAILVKDNMIISTGYNGAPRSVKHCTECLRRRKKDYSSGGNLNNCPAVHGEVNAIVQAAYHGISTKDSIMFSLVFPCVECMKTIINAGITKVYYRMSYEVSDELKHLYDRIEVIKVE